MCSLKKITLTFKHVRIRGIRNVRRNILQEKRNKNEKSIVLTLIITYQFTLRSISIAVLPFAVFGMICIF